VTVTFEWFALQYRSDALRAEGTSFAVLASIEGRGWLAAHDLAPPRTAPGERLARVWAQNPAERHGTVAGTAQFRAASGLSPREAEFYPEVLDALMAIADDAGATPQGLEREMDYLAGRHQHILPVLHGHAEADTGELPSAALERVFARVVGRVPERRVDRFPDRLEALLRCSEVLAHPEIRRDVRIDVLVGPERRAVSLELDLAGMRDWSRGLDTPVPRNVGVRFVGGPGRRRALADAETAFRTALDIGLIVPERLAMVVDAPGLAAASAVCRALGTGCLDIDDEQTSHRLHDLVWYR
jgi:hypothetical protein